MISHPSASGRQRTVEFQTLPSRTGQVRRILSALLRYWELESLVEPAAVGVAELMADVHRRVGPDRPCSVEIVLLPDRLTFSLRGQDPGPSGPLGAGGRGPLPAASSGGGPGPGAGQDDSGKVAWFTLPVHARKSPAPVPGGMPGKAPGRGPLPSPEPLPAPDPLPRPEPLPRSHAPAPAAPVRASAGAALQRP
ncbi:ATP-binding protein [Streptomyces glaucosporus]|uniref:ATP-binding protein n=1 Tax=Streptomyces glaucosporus TaxID=284044 RepID=A0ABP5VJY5_9ACTN